ncbi:MFS transporter [Elioraea sp.]|uniref:MFS transporter n=1 Tax=Elioraea sp. TaxID=2185103 RepID=UPI00262FBF92|nr:MFS transporter [Elioraea sp.]
MNPPAPLPLPVLILTGFLSGTGIRVADPLLALIASGFGASVAAAAPVVAGFTLAYGLAQPVLGPLGDRLGKLRLIAGCMALYGAATLAAALAPSLGALTAARAVAGAFAGGLIPVAIALIGDRTSYETRQATLGRFMTGMVMANLITAPLAGVAGDAVGWRPVFGLLGLAALAAGVPLWREAARTPAVAHAPGVGALARYAMLLRRPAARRLLLLVGFEGALAFGAPPFIGAFLVEGHGLSFTGAGLVLGAAGLGALLYTRIAGWLVRRFGERGLLVGGGAGLVLWLGGVAAAPPPVVAATNLVGGFALGAFHGVLQARGSEMLPESRSTGMAAFAFCLFVGLAAGAAIVGALLPLIGYRALFAGAAAGIAVLAAAAVGSEPTARR